MNISKLTKVCFVSSLLGLSLLQGVTNAQNSRNIYRCINNNGNPTTVVDTPRGRIQLISWKSDYFRTSGWTPQKRCQEVTRRFQRFSDNGTLRYITTGNIDKIPVICVGQKMPGRGYTCIKDGLLLTLQSNDNPNEVLKNLFTNAARVGGNPVSRDPSGTFVFPVNDFLEKAETTEIPNETEEKIDSEESIPMKDSSDNSQSQRTPDTINICPPTLCD